MINSIVKLLKSIKELKRFTLSYSCECYSKEKNLYCEAMDEIDDGEFLRRDDVINTINTILDDLQNKNYDIKKNYIVKIIKGNTGVYNIFVKDKQGFKMLFFNEGKDFNNFSKEICKELIRIKYEEDDKK